MALQRTEEPLGNGYVNTRGASSLARGELSDGLNMTYGPGSDAISIANAASVSTTLSGGTIAGLRFLKFSGGTEFGFAQNSSTNSYYYFNGSAYVTIGGTITTGADVDVATYNGRHYVFNGANANQVLYLDGSTKTMRAHGVTAVSTAPSLTLFTGTWPFDTGVYEYWTTEVVVITEGSNTFRIESDFTGAPATVTVVASSSVLITKPATLANASATYWRIYRAGPRVNTGVSLYPLGELLGEFPITTVAVRDGLGIDTGWKRPTKTSGGADWTNLAGITAGTQHDGANTVVVDPGDATATIYGYSLGTVGDPISGVSLYIRAGTTGVAPANFYNPTVAVSFDGGSHWSAEFGMPLCEGGYWAYPASDANNVMGADAATLWGLETYATAANLNVADNLRVRITPNLLLYGGGDPGIDMNIDDCDARVYYGGDANEPSGAFPFYSLSVDGAAVSGSMLGAPPISSTGAVIEDSLVVNDISSPGLIRYSPTGSPEYFPSLYYMRLDLGASEPVTVIRSVGGRLVAATARALYRINYLPRVFDASFDRGRPVELITDELGIYGPKGCTTITNPLTGRPALAFIGNDGNVYVTDGFDVRALAPDITIGSSVVSGAFLINSSITRALGLFYGTSTHATTRLELHYHPNHMKPGGALKASVPIELGDKFASGGYNVAGGFIELGHHSTASDITHLFRTSLGQGTSSFGSSAYVTTRRFWPTGMGHEARLNAVYLSDDGTTISGTYAMTPFVSLANTAEATMTAVTKTYSSLSPPVLKFDTSTLVEGLRLKFALTSSSGGFAMWNHGIVEYEDFGREQSGA